MVYFVFKTQQYTIITKDKLSCLWSAVPMMGSCVCKDKTATNVEVPSSPHHHSRLSVDALYPSEPDGSSSSSGYHGSTSMVPRTASKKTLVHALVLETLAVIRTLIDKYVLWLLYFLCANFIMN